MEPIMAREHPVSSFSVVIPTLNPRSLAQRLISALRTQDWLAPGRVIILDSESNDGSMGQFREAGFRVFTVPRDSFDHGGTRNIGWRHCTTDVIVFLAQDAIPVGSRSIATLCAPF